MGKFRRGEVYNHRVTSTEGDVVENEKLGDVGWDLQQRDYPDTDEYKAAEVYQAPP